MIGRISQKKILNFTESLETFLISGFTIHDSLKAIAEQIDSKTWKNIVLGLEQDIASGFHLSEALKNHPGVFSEFYINVVEAGEMSGEMEKAITRLRKYLEKKLDLKRNLINNMTYPAIMFLIGIAVVSFLFTKVLPVIVKMLQQMRVALPVPTRILISIVQFVKTYGLGLLGIIIIVIICLKLILRNPNIKQSIHWLVLRTPLIGKLILLVEMERFSNILSTMLKSGIPLPSALPQKMLQGIQLFGIVFITFDPQ